jgi:hypothetical protein
MAPPTLVQTWVKSPRSQGFYISGLAVVHQTSPFVFTSYDFAIINLTPRQTSQSRIALRRVAIQGVGSQAGLRLHWGVISGDVSQTWLHPTNSPIVATAGPAPQTSLSEPLGGSDAPTNLAQLNGVIDCFAEAWAQIDTANEEYWWGPEDIVSEPGNPLQLVIFAPFGPSGESFNADVSVTVAIERYIKRAATAEPGHAIVQGRPQSTS